MNQKHIFEAMQGSRKVIQEGARLSPALRQTVNRDFDAAFKNKLWDKPGRAMATVEEILNRNGLQGPGMYSGSDFMGDSGSRRFIVQTRPDGEEIFNAMLIVSWGKAGDNDRFDVNIYMS